MLTPQKDIYCGIFDSELVRKNSSASSPRRVECFELELFHTAGGTSYINDMRYPTQRGMLLCAKPGQIRHSIFPVRCSFIRIFPGAEAAVREVLSAMPDQTYLRGDAEIDRLLGLFARLGDCFIARKETVAERVRIHSLFFEILYHCLATAEEAAGEETHRHYHRAVREACHFIDENYLGDCALQTIAAAVGVTPHYLQSIFSKEVGLSPYRYTINKRLEKAKKLILTEEKSMLEIAWETGFCSQSHFNKVFKQYENETPQQYRYRQLAHLYLSE